MADKLREVVNYVYLNKTTVKSNYARENAEIIAMAASSGLLTTKVSKGIYSSEWRPTSSGLNYLSETEDQV